MKISVDAEELIDYGVLEKAAEKYCSQYSVSKEELVNRLKEEQNLSLWVSEGDAIKWGIINRPTELF